jgi:pimeloyl-ACP methyl ester carboxylesterase
MLTRTTASRLQQSALGKLQRGFAICALVLSGCTSTPPQLLDTPRVNVAGTQIAYAQSGAGTPVVVFENGLAAQKEVWAEVASVIAKTHTAFTYDRPGQGASSSSNQPRNGSQIVEDLRSLLKSQHLEPPYVLVGHSLGALYMQLYARKYPQEVCGLVLVDSTHPLHFAGDGAQEKRSFLSRTVMAVGLWGNASQEFKNIGATGQEVLALPSLRTEIAAVILIAPQNSASADPADAALNQRDDDLRWDFTKLYPSAQVRETHTGHNAHRESPKLVVQAIEEVLAKAVKLEQ